MGTQGRDIMHQKQRRVELKATMIIYMQSADLISRIICRVHHMGRVQVGNRGKCIWWIEFIRSDNYFVLCA